MTPEEKPSSADSHENNCVEICWLSLTSAMHLKVCEAEKAIRYHFHGLFQSGAWSQAAQVAEAVGKLEEARAKVHELWWNHVAENDAKALEVSRAATAQLEAALALLKEVKK